MVISSITLSWENAIQRDLINPHEKKSLPGICTLCTIKCTQIIFSIKISEQKEYGEYFNKLCDFTYFPWFNSVSYSGLMLQMPANDECECLVNVNGKRCRAGSGAANAIRVLG